MEGEEPETVCVVEAVCIGVDAGTVPSSIPLRNFKEAAFAGLFQFLADKCHPWKASRFLDQTYDCRIACISGSLRRTIPPNMKSRGILRTSNIILEQWNVEIDEVLKRSIDVAAFYQLNKPMRSLHF